MLAVGSNIHGFNNGFLSANWQLTRYSFQVGYLPTTEYIHVETPSAYIVKVLRHNYSKNPLQGLEMKLVKPSKKSKKAKLVMENNDEQQWSHTYDLEEIDANNITWTVKTDPVSTIEVVVPKRPSKGEILQKRKIKRKIKSSRKHSSQKQDPMKECEDLLYKQLYNENLQRLQLPDIWEDSDTESSESE